MESLGPAAQRFVVHWGEMGDRWGVNRTVAQIHALLFVSSQPLNAEQISATLSIARSNVSTSLRELEGWGLVRIVHRMGDRRDYFDTFEDVWEMFRIVLDERKRREIDPTITILRECMLETDPKKKSDAHTRKRLQDLLSFFEIMSTWYVQIRALPQGAVLKFVKLGGRVGQLWGVAG